MSPCEADKEDNKGSKPDITQSLAARTTEPGDVEIIALTLLIIIDEVGELDGIGKILTNGIEGNFTILFNNGINLSLTKRSHPASVSTDIEGGSVIVANDKFPGKLKIRYKPKRDIHNRME
jgi:hypothetical protein